MRERMARIDETLAAVSRHQAEIDQRRVEIRLAPLSLVISGATAGAAVFAAGVAFAKLFFPG